MGKITLILLLIASSAAASDIIKFKNGMTFDHKGHQSEKVGKCYVCHDNVAVSKDEKIVTSSNPSKIAGFGKDWAHKNCTDCHDLFAAGPVTCNECHHTSVSSAY
jgi:hypothetical protein